ncbi:MAG: hypothetical protein WD942_03645, partial [Dehalococcoidia bacterium]
DTIRDIRAGRCVHRLNPPTVQWGPDFVEEVIGGNATGESFVDLAGSGRMGAGDISILVEREEFLDRSQYAEAEIWSLDAELLARS